MPMMAVTFHHGPKEQAALEDYCCQLVGDCYLQGGNLLVTTSDAEQLQRLRQLLWELPNSFIPSGGLDDPSKPPVLLDGSGELDEKETFTTLIVAPGAAAPDYMGRFEQVHYLVLADGGEAHSKAREDLRKLTEAGVKPQTKNIS